MNNLINNNEQLMTVKELAEILGVGKKTISRIVKNNFPEIVKNGITTYLNQKQVTFIKLELSKRHNLVSTDKLENVTTDLEVDLYVEKALRLQKEKIIRQKQKIEQLSGQNQLMKPKAEFYDTVTQTDDWRDISEVAKLLNLGYGNITLFKKLREDKILMSNNLPYQKYVTKRYFRVVEKPYYKGKQRCISYKTVVSQKGVEYLNKKYGLKV